MLNVCASNAASASGENASGDGGRGTKNESANAAAGASDLASDSESNGDASAKRRASATGALLRTFSPPLPVSLPTTEVRWGEAEKRLPAKRAADE